ncbi:5-formyltetrahydrofolate cyclo-ligase [Carbonactinospora thermoautotrophica]|uniref:5-formyltetrahydrofolate cyclo-ligase n=1 Tax=Carbonactinospora thermoautotrophica TaxID=1469144 RepID=UPI00226D97CF|nr:5-formyltetrahydrofolate cyclo-ligase [Carbonactinospora thermoautotrophica]
MDQFREKRAIRSRILANRATLGAAERRTLGAALRDRALALPEVARAGCVACYVSVGSEPDTRELLTALYERGVRVLLPVLLPDLDLDWGVYAGEGSLTPGRRGLLEPAGDRLGVSGVAAADVVLVPAVAVDRRGVRLGRGGGSYDRALTRVPPGRLVAALLYDGELVESVPALPHDQPVGAAITPSRVHRFDARG